MENKETFNYTYSAKEQEEIKKIREKYVEKEQKEDKISRLRRLDAAVIQKATVIALVFGIFGALTMGLGMSLVMTEFGNIFSMNEKTSMLFGIIIGVIGMILSCMAYPIYNRTVKTERKKIAPEIIRLSDELIK